MAEQPNVNLNNGITITKPIDYLGINIALLLGLSKSIIKMLLVSTIAGHPLKQFPTKFS